MTVNLEYAQDHLVELLDHAAQGQAVIIERDGKPSVQVSGLPPATPFAGKRTGFMRGQIQIPDDFDTMGASEIERLFESGE